MKGKDGKELNPRYASVNTIREALAWGETTVEEALIFIEKSIWLRKGYKPEPKNQTEIIDSPHTVFALPDYSGPSEEETILELEILQDELKKTPPPFLALAISNVQRPPLRINIRGGNKQLAAMLMELEEAGTIDHLTDAEVAELFTIQGKPVNTASLKTIRNRDLNDN